MYPVIKFKSKYEELKMLMIGTKVQEAVECMVSKDRIRLYM